MDRSDAAGRTSARPELVLWAACVNAFDLDQRAAAVRAGSFDCMSIACSDLVKIERRGGSVADTARRLRDEGAPITVLDPVVSWYPGFTQSTVAGAHADAQNVDVATALRLADEVGATSFTLIGPFSGSPASHDAATEALGDFADRAATAGLAIHVEVIPTSMIPTIDVGWPLVRDVGRDNVGLVLDMFHLGRSGCTTQQLDEIPADRVLHVQLCDAPRTPRLPSYFDEAVTIRDWAGEGELPVAELCRSLHERGAFGHVGPEVFSPEHATLDPVTLGRRCRAKTDEFLADLGIATDR